MKCSHDMCIREAAEGSDYCDRCIQLPAKECNRCDTGKKEEETSQRAPVWIRAIATIIFIGMLVAAGWYYLFVITPAMLGAIPQQTDSIPVIKNTSIYSLDDSSTIRGKFFLGTGTIKDSPCFVFYKGEGGVYQLERIPAEYTKIIEDENDHPYLSDTTFAIVYRNSHGITEVVQPDRWSPHTYVLHVPNGTIRRSFNADSEL